MLRARCEVRIIDGRESAFTKHTSPPTTFMDPIAPVLLMLLAVIAVVLALTTGRRSVRATCVVPPLSPAETRVLEGLQDAFGKSYNIYPKVSATAIFGSMTNDAESFPGDSRSILYTRAVDFLICLKASGAIAAAVLLTEHADGINDPFVSAAKSAFYAVNIPVYEMDLDRGFSTTEIALQMSLGRPSLSA